MSRVLGAPPWRERLQALVAALIVACGRTTPAPAPPESGASAPVASARADASAAPPARELWQRAQEGTEEDLMRLADEEGPSGLVEGAIDPASTRCAASAMAHTRGHAGLPWLALLASGGDPELAKLALRSAVELASKGRTQLDPEDFEELRAGCDKLLVFARDTGHDRALRIDAVRVLRLLSDRGCAKREDIPTDVDAR